MKKREKERERERERERESVRNAFTQRIDASMCLP